MMNCRQFKARLFAFQDGGLAAAEKVEFERHAHECPACAALAGDAREIGERLRAAAAPIPAPDWDNAWRGIRAAVPAAGSRPLIGVPRWAAAAAFLAVFILGIAAARLFFFPARAHAPAAGEPAFLYSAGDYFAALQPLMASYANAPAPGQGAAADRARARQLLNDLYLLKQRAAKSRDVSMKHLLDEIELILLEIVHLDPSDPQQARQLGELIRENGISLKMSVFKSDGRMPVRI